MILTESVRGTKFYISWDLEGMTGIVSGEDYEKNFATFQKLIFREVKAVLDGIYGTEEVAEVVICDAHAWEHNIPIENLPPKTFLVRGVPRNLGMMEGLAEDFDGVFFIGYHSKAGEPFSVLDHTYSSATFYSIEINGEEVSETLLNAAIAGHFGIPLLFVAGDDKVIKEVKERISPDIECVITKYSVSRFGAINRSPDEVAYELRERAKVAVGKRRLIKPFQFSYPCDLELTLLDTLKADLCSLIPDTERIGGRKIRYKAKDIIEVHRIIRLSAILGLAGREFYR